MAVRRSRRSAHRRRHWNYCIDEAKWIGVRLPHPPRLGMDRILDRQKLDGLEEKPVYLTIDLDYFDPRSFRRPAPGAGRRRVVADAGFLDH